MNNPVGVIPACLIFLFGFACAAGAPPPPRGPDQEPAYRRPDLPVQVRVDDLLGRMTVEEKVDQLHLCAVGDTNPNNRGGDAAGFRPTWGCFIIGGPTSLAARNALQQRVLAGSRLGIPALFGADVIHGYRAITPIPLAQACSWNPDLVEAGCAMAAREAKAQGIDWTFAPMVDHCVDPRWGRVAETFGESPQASAVFSAASVRGFQGRVFGGPQCVAACLKHFVGYGASEGGRDYAYTEISPQTLWEMHLPAFEAGVGAGARTVMSAFNDLSGIPASANAYTLTEVLRRRWGLTGPVVSDWGAVAQLVNQGFAADGQEAVAKAIGAGVDIDMSDGLYRMHLASLVASGRVSRARLDEAVGRVLRLKFELGLFEHPLTPPSVLTGAAPNSGQLEVAEELAAESMVLLKNDGVLPVAPSTRQIALIGPLADCSGPLLGCWAQQGRADETPSIARALRERLPSGTRLVEEAGCSIQGEGADTVERAVKAARASDLVILCVGEEGWMSGENASRSSLRLAGHQEALARAVAATGRPVVLVLVSGRPLELEAFEGSMGAIVEAWEGGSRAAAALADILLGRRNPSGRLALTWPRTAGQIPLYHNMRPPARDGDNGLYRDAPSTPLYPFAHGLGYTPFAYGPIRLSSGQVGRSGRLTAEVWVRNTGGRAGVETVFWFIHQRSASITRPVRELKHFERASIDPGGRRLFSFEIDPMRDLSFPDGDGRRLLEPGAFELYAGDRSASFRLSP